MGDKTGSRSSGKGNMDVRRGIVLRFLSGCHEEELEAFFDFSFNIYKPMFKGKKKY